METRSYYQEFEKWYIDKYWPDLKLMKSIVIKYDIKSETNLEFCFYVFKLDRLIGAFNFKSYYNDFLKEQNKQVYKQNKERLNNEKTTQK